MATSADDPLVRKEVMTAIGKLGPALIAALPAMLEHAAIDSDDLVRMEALHCLVSIQAPAAKRLPVAITALESNNPRVRNAARYLPGTIGDDAHVAESVLGESLHGSDELKRLPSAWALVHVAPSNENIEAAIPLLLTASRDLNPDVRLEAAAALGKIGAGSKDVRAALQEAPGDTVPAVKEAVIMVLKTVQQKQSRNRSSFKPVADRPSRSIAWLVIGCG